MGSPPHVNWGSGGLRPPEADAFYILRIFYYNFRPNGGVGPIEPPPPPCIRTCIPGANVVFALRLEQSFLFLCKLKYISGRIYPV